MGNDFAYQLQRCLYLFNYNILELGVYCPVTQREFSASFKTTTPRVITLALDFNDNSLKFWLNDKYMENRTIKLDMSNTPLIPYAKLSKEKK